MTILRRPPLEGLTQAEAHWIEYIWSSVTPRLLGGSEERARTAAIVTWWALKEGVLDPEAYGKPNPWQHNNCGAGGDHEIGNLEVCPPGPAWQVGMAGIQPGNIPLAHVEDVARQIYPGENHQDLLRRIAQDARIQDSNILSAIMTSTGELKKAWLLRDPAIAFTIQRPFVEDQCIRGNYAWCYGTWDTAQRFARDKTRIQDVLMDLTSYFRTAPSRSAEAESASSKVKVVLVLALLGAGAYYLYSTTSGKKLRRRAEAKLLSW